MSQSEAAYPVERMNISGTDNVVKKYKVRRVGINWGEDGVHSVGTIECSLEDAFKVIELMLQGYNVEGFYPGQERQAWLLPAVYQDDNHSLNAAYIIKEGDIPVAFYQGGQWFLPDELKSKNEASEMTTTTETVSETAVLQRGYYEFPQYESLLLVIQDGETMPVLSETAVELLKTARENANHEAWSLLDSRIKMALMKEDLGTLILRARKTTDSELQDLKIAEETRRYLRWVKTVEPAAWEALNFINTKVRDVYPFRDHQPGPYYS